jgi:hypothetical protein
MQLHRYFFNLFGANEFVEKINSLKGAPWAGSKI